MPLAHRYQVDFEKNNERIEDPPRAIFPLQARRRDLNPRPPRPEEYEFCPLRCECLFIAVSTPREILFGGLVSVVSVCSERVYGQICGHFLHQPKRNF